jgi:hypothetical protein
MSEPEDRVQTGVRMTPRMLKVLRALADYKDMSLGDLMEGIILHAFENKPPFSKETLGVVAKLRDVYGLELTSRDAHTLRDAGDG